MGFFSVTQTTYGSKRNQISSIKPFELTQLKVISMPIQTLWNNNFIIDLYMENKSCKGL